MALWKVTWFFSGFQAGSIGAGSAVGWTETWAMNTASGNIDDVFIAPDVLTYTNLRQNCLSNQYRIEFLRVTSISQPPTITPRLVKIQTLPNLVGGASVMGSGGAQVQCAVLVDMQKLPTAGADRVHHRKFLIRGLPPDVIAGNVINRVAPNWSRFETLFNFVANKPTGTGPNNPARATQLGIAYQDQVNFPAVPCPQLAVDAGNPRVLQLRNDITAYSPGEVIRIRGWKGIDGVQFNRAWNFISTQAGPPQAAFVGKSRFDMEPGVSTFPNAAMLQRVRFASGPLDQYAVIGLRSKRTGRVFHQLVGRSRRRVSP